MHFSKMKRSPTPPSYSRAAHIMVKPIGPRCNLRCKYCFYLEKHALFPDDESYRMSDEVQETFIREYIKWQNSPKITFAWQGGEPTLLGVDFFRRAVALQKQYGDGRPISNTLQTNGTLLNDEWCRFLGENNFLIGLSIDGPKEIHDGQRIDPSGNGSFNDVMKGMSCLKKHRVEFNTLTCMHRGNGDHGRRVYRFLREQGVKHMQFIPIIERAPCSDTVAKGLQLEPPPALDNPSNSTEVMPFTLLPEQYGKFLIDIFNEWVKRDVGTIFVNHIEVALNAWCGNNPPLCVHSKACGNALAMEHDGSVYACDHYVYPEYCRGNIMEDTLQQVVFNLEQQEFGVRKWTALPQHCKICPVLAACHGGCPKHRFCSSPEKQPGMNYLCDGYKAFFTHIAPTMTQIAALLRQGRSATEVMRLAPARK